MLVIQVLLVFKELRERKVKGDKKVRLALMALVENKATKV